MNKRIWWLIGGLVLLLGVSCVVCFGTGVVGMLLSTRPPEDVEVTLRYPEEVTSGEDFVVEVIVRNLAQRERTLNSIDIDDTLLEGCMVLRTQPPVHQVIPLNGFTSYFFEHSIAPRGEITVQLHMRGTQAGLHQGNVDVCIDGMGRCVSHNVIITVVP